MKKLLAIVLSLLLAFSVSIVAFAEGGSEDPAPASAYSITIDNAVKGETYTAYKIFDVVYSGTNAAPGTVPAAPAADNTHMHENYAYTLSPSSEWFQVITNMTSAAAASATSPFEYNGLKFTRAADGSSYAVEATESFDAAAFAETLATAKSGKTAAASAAASGTTLTLEIPDTAAAGAGYYFVDTSLGSLCSLDTTEPNATIREKNTQPTIDKKISDTSSGPWGDATDVNIGDTVYFKTEVTDGVGTDAIITVHDKMDPQLVLNTGNDAFSVKVGSTDVPAAKYTIKTTGLTDDCTFEIAFTADYVATLNEGDVITITYSAVLNNDAIICEDPSTDFQKNTTYLTYQAQTSSEVTVKAYTYDFDLIKYNGNSDATPKAKLAGAHFTLNRDNTPIELIKVNDKEYRVAKNGETPTTTDIVSVDGIINIKGLDKGAYTIKETAAPEGFNALAEDINLYISGVADDNTEASTDTAKQGKVYKEAAFTTQWSATKSVNPAEADTIEVENRTGSELPSTGGIGTYIFYILGGILVLGAGIVLVARKRNAAAAE